MNAILDTRKDNFREKFYYLVENYDLWIWDFDLTLTKIHTYKEKLDSYLVGRKKQRDLENDFWDANFFISFVNYLILNDKKVATSMNTASQLSKKVQKLGEEIGFNKKYATIKRMEIATKRNFRFKPLKDYCKRHELDIKKVSDINYFVYNIDLICKITN